MKSFQTPILLITFNRPEYTKRVLEAILAAHPKELFVFQDGAREENTGDVEKCAEVRRVVEDMTKDAGVTLHTNYAHQNLGCGPGPAAAISWFFENVEAGIIIEDDAVPHPDFFPYCEELLEKYKGDSDIRAIGSMNVDTQRWGDGSYYFSMMNRNLCAWATWKRAWEAFDIKMENVSRRKLRKALRHYGCGALECEYWCDRLDEVHKDLCGGKSWDMQFFMSIWMRGGKGIIPNVNLSSNIGTVGEATHVMGEGNIIDNVPSCPIMPLRHPSNTNVQHAADKQFHFRYFEPAKNAWGVGKTIYYLVNKRVKRLVGHEGPWIKRK
ncbi:MAG: hypothetical protein IKQ94_00895 [Bacteroidales bacterium]|nr:hypothetical protein [Bacteroidales bacterium]